MQIRNAQISDLPQILEIYAHARAFMAENGNPRQWAARSWPPEALVRRDIAEGKSYVCENSGRILGVFYFHRGHAVEPTYAHITNGNWIGDEDYGVVHRIASIQRGIGSFCISWALKQCGHLRIDTHADNIPMQRLLQKLDFTSCGTIFVHEDQDPRIAFEKVLQER